MDRLIGRPRDKGTDGLRCPRCRNRELRKSGFRLFVNQKGRRKTQAYICRLCHFQTTRPIREGPDG